LVTVANEHDTPNESIDSARRRWCCSASCVFVRDFDMLSVDRQTHTPLSPVAINGTSPARNGCHRRGVWGESRKKIAASKLFRRRLMARVGMSFAFIFSLFAPPLPPKERKQNKPSALFVSISKPSTFNRNTESIKVSARPI
jgi:hypothetical protein